MGNQVIVGIDLDGVIFDYSFAFSKLLQELYGPGKPIIHDEDATNWDWTKWYPVTRKEIVNATQYLIHRLPHFWEELPPLAGRLADILALNDNPQITVYFLTSRVTTELNNITRQSAKSLSNLGWINPQVIVTSKKDIFVRELGIQYFVDDKPENCISVKKMNPECKVYLMASRHNYAFTVPDTVIPIQALDIFTSDVMKGLFDGKAGESETRSEKLERK